ncbi:MAG: hypothetical protein M3384_19490, partial [Acidobacteriota bacterium]|nr:hypothetical protein [Acidobacteriota bacterium]
RCFVARFRRLPAQSDDGDKLAVRQKLSFENMSGAAKSLFVFGIYLCGLGLLLLLVPNMLLQLFGVPQTSEVWIRVNGMFVLCLSFYYIQAARGELTNFIRWTILGRGAVVFYFAAFVLLVSSAPKALLLFGLIDLLSALWTWLALKKDEEAASGKI